ncbi:hypothetical protein DUNSADRAFT_16482 [Dunaliella salina]|uniref:Uncharacterized protein n=1 Tax=Dunaliella salina TaxID=3046 RepID=A0ABQ7G3I4_DUNSA|nr:hypothetical protein DUNSADRAFT_16482 [Dunaliella salina]|eukprot:KAF5829168.1 hypothetical protein DUNSADRAFT_16482 [Dunaliella salina]
MDSKLLLPTLLLLYLSLGQTLASRQGPSTQGRSKQVDRRDSDFNVLVEELQQLKARTDAIALKLGALEDGITKDDISEDSESDLSGGENSDGPYQKKGFCDKKSYRKHTLKVIKEAPFVGLFNDLRNITRFEGSAITYAKGFYWAIFDSLRAIARINLGFNFRGEANLLIPEDKGEYESQFEGLQYSPSTDTFLAVRETAVYEEHGLVPQIEEIKIADDLSEWTLIHKCPVRFQVEAENKGWESIVYFDGQKGERFLMGLCESNYCKSSSGKDAPGTERGNGRLVLSQFVEGDEETKGCHWDVLKVIHLPKEADYAGIAFNDFGHGKRVAVVSQEDAAVWVGEFDWTRMEFVGEGEIQHFPRNSHCDQIYCNVEGVTWLDDERFIFATDASKSKQGHECMSHDQSVVIAALSGRMPEPRPEPEL